MNGSLQVVTGVLTWTNACRLIDLSFFLYAQKYSGFLYLQQINVMEKYMVI